MGFNNAADRRGQYASGPDVAPVRKGFGRSEDQAAFGEMQSADGGLAGGGTYDGPALRALAEGYLQQRVGLSADNPYRRYVQEFQFHSPGLTGEFSDFAKLALGQRLNEALRYEALSKNAEKMFPGDASPFARIREQRMAGGTTRSAS